MFQGILDIALGLVFMYLLLSLVVTAISEMVTGALSLRAKNLRTGHQKLLDDPNAQGLFNDICTHPLIRCADSTSGSKGPSYIPSKTFALALLDNIAPGTPSQGSDLFAHVNAKIGGISNTTVKGVLEALSKEAQGDFDRFRQSVATWYDDAMDRLSGQFKRKIQLLLLGLGLAVSVGFNADTISVTKALWTDSALRAAIATQASEFVRTGDTARYEEARAQLSKFPIGWTELPESGWGVASKIAGLLITAIAVALGAPFWFEVLQKVNAIRSNGPKPPKANRT